LSQNKSTQITSHQSNEQAGREVVALFPVRRKRIELQETLLYIKKSPVKIEKKDVS
jgi:hypothetical protein